LYRDRPCSEYLTKPILTYLNVVKRLISLIAVFEAFALSVFMINIWYLALLNGQSITLRIDAYGEMWVEYVLWLVLTPVLVLGLHYTVEQIQSPE